MASSLFVSGVDVNLFYAVLKRNKIRKSSKSNTAPIINKLDRFYLSSWRKHPQAQAGIMVCNVKLFKGFTV